MENTLDRVREQLRLEAEGIRLAMLRLGPEMQTAVEILFYCKGKVVVTGMGKTGIIARKISATFASTGTTSIFLHAAEGIHGDLGMIESNDVVVAVSYSGNTDELIAIIPYLKFHGVPIISITGNLTSRLAVSSDVVIDGSVPENFDPFGLVPTSSTTLALALGDALAVALLEKKEFTESDFAQFHPGGTIGKKLLLRVEDLMHSGDSNPVVSGKTSMSETIVEMTSKGLGCAAVIDESGKLIGIITDGDLRRMLEQESTILQQRAEKCMTASPRCGSPRMLAVDALILMEESLITMLPIIDEGGKPIGMLHMHDLIRAGVVG
ncbi:MAG: KpsF/GutQ family sugar-phosphate isomerase [Candidatus Cloacimonetes bacterium]|nr:KpsF/GutQ family sugar-phosphate isomerase [Candidatus Cloacimonadota bacterium]